MKYYLARDGVAFGPYSAFQVRESVRLGIFFKDDLALAEDGKDWLEVSKLLPAADPVDRDLFMGPPEPPPTETKPLEGAHRKPAEALVGTGARRIFTPQIVAFVAVPLGVMVLYLITFNAVLQRRRQPAKAVPPFVAQHRVPPVQTLVKSNPLLTAVSLPLGKNAPSGNTGGLHATLDSQPAEPAKPQLPAPATKTAASDEKTGQGVEPVPAAVPAPTGEAVPPAQTTDPAAAPASSPASALPAPSAAARPESHRIEGQMFIGGPDVLGAEPAAVEVRLYPLAALKPYLERRGTEASSRFEELKPQIAAAEAEKERARRNSDAAFDAFVRADANDPAKPALEQANVAARKARETAANAYYGLMQERENIQSGAYYAEQLPKTDEITQTDSQGRFFFDVPAAGDFAVVAGVQRNEQDTTRRYYWFVPVSVEESSKEVLLSEHNISSQGSSDSLVQTVD
jgi:hypothetical protein